jgi:hypothetical protein
MVESQGFESQGLGCRLDSEGFGDQFYETGFRV